MEVGNKTPSSANQTIVFDTRHGTSDKTLGFTGMFTMVGHVPSPCAGLPSTCARPSACRAAARMFM